MWVDWGKGGEGERERDYKARCHLDDGHPSYSETQYLPVAIHYADG